MSDVLTPPPAPPFDDDLIEKALDREESYMPDEPLFSRRQG